MTAPLLSHGKISTLTDPAGFPFKLVIFRSPLSATLYANALGYITAVPICEADSNGSIKGSNF
jgi:hypothetical protein